MADPAKTFSEPWYYSDANTTVTHTVGTPLTPGSTLVLFVSAPLGNASTGRITQVADSVNGTWPPAIAKLETAFSGDLYVFAFVNNASSGTPELSITAESAYAALSFVFFEVSPADTSSSVDTSNTITNSYGTDGRIGSLTTSAITLDMGVVVDILAAGGARTPDAGWNGLAFANSVSGSAVDKVNAAGTINGGITFAASTASIGCSIAIKGTAGGGAATSLPPFRSFPQALLAR